jgi:probable F420-dependent oxidoreductase
VQASSAASGDAWRELAVEVESLGYSTLSMPDHFGSQLALVPAMAAAAAATRSVRIGALVFANDFKHPVVLAKEAATLDLLSGGRLELGLGAGWMTTDYEQSGMTMDSPGTRIDRMVEGLAVIRGLMAEGPFSFSGRHYSIKAMDGQPKPVQRPHPPILIGGGGHRILRIAAGEADIVGVSANLKSGRVGPHMAHEGSAASFADKVEWVREAAGPRFDALELNVNLAFVQITPDRDVVAAGVGQFMEQTAEDILRSPLVLMGTEAQIIDDLERRRETYGISYIHVPAQQMQAFAPVVERLAGH